MTVKNEVKKLVDYINSIGLIIRPRPPSPKHIGAIIADAVLQVGHGWKKYVAKRVEHIIKNYPNASNINGIISIINKKEIRKFLDWNGQDVQNRFIASVEFFNNEQIDTFDQLYNWLEKDENRDRLITKSSRIDKAGIAKIGDATADYYRVLVRLPDAVKVDSLVKEFLKEAGININQYKYEDWRYIVQLAAKELNKRPLDLDGAIWNYMENKSQNNKRGESMNSEENGSEIDSEEETTSNKKGKKERLSLIKAEEFADNKELKKEAEYIKSLVEYGISYKAREALFMRLFQREKKWDEFLENKWEYGKKPDGQNRIKEFNRLSLKFVNFLKDIAEKRIPYDELGILGENATSQIEQPHQTTTQNSITINLSKEYWDKLEKIAQECGVDKDTVARILIVTQLS